MFQNIICNSFYYHNLTKSFKTGYYKKKDETCFYNLGINWIMKNVYFMAELNLSIMFTQSNNLTVFTCFVYSKIPQ